MDEKLPDYEHTELNKNYPSKQHVTFEHS